MPMSVLDIGASKIMCVQGRAYESGVEIVGAANCASYGFSDGVLLNLDECEDSILRAVEMLERSTSEDVKKIYVSVGGQAVSSVLVSLSSSIFGERVAEEDLQALFRKAYDLELLRDNLIIHMIPLGYKIDSRGGILDPRSMSGEVLEVQLLLILLQRSYAEGVEHILQRCHIELAGYISTAYASSISTLLESEKDNGVLHIDLGARTTAVSIYSNGNLIDLFHFSVGGDFITKDIALGLGTRYAEAERLKVLYGSSIVEQGDERKMLDVSFDDDKIESRKISRLFFINIINSRVEEIFELIDQKLQKKRLSFPMRIVLTGGASQLPGVLEKAERILKGSVRLGLPFNVLSHSSPHVGPDFSVCSGMLQLAASGEGAFKSVRHKKTRGVFRRLKAWLYDNI